MNFFSRFHPTALAYWFSKKASQKTDDGETAVQNGQNEQTEKIEALLESVNSASQHVRNFYITFLLAGFYIAVIIWSTTDVMLLKDTPIKLPILDVELSITGFYQFAPYFFLLLHFNLLLQLCLLADKVHRFDDAVIKLGDQNTRRYYYARLFAFAFTHTLSGRHHSGFLRFLLTVLVWVTIIWLPLSILIGLQVGFIAYHDEDILFWQRVAITLDLLILAIFWPIIRSIDGNGFGWIKKQFVYLSWMMNLVKWLLSFKTVNQLPEKPDRIKANDGQVTVEGGLSLVTTLSVFLFSWGIAVLPDSDHEIFVGKIIPASWLTDKPLNERNPEGKPYFYLTGYFFDDGIFNRNLVLKEQLLVANDLPAEVEWAISHGDEGERENALKKVRKLILSGRDFRYADFSEARLPKADFVGANDDPSDLSYSNFQIAILKYARMIDVELQGADLSGAELQGANLWSVELQGAYLRSAKLQGAYLGDAKLQGADLSRANLQGAYLRSAEMRGADLRWADLQGANLRLAKLQGADLSRANLQGADLGGARLQGADLGDAVLQGANLSWARLQGANLRWADLQGANLSRAKLQGADLSGADLQGASLVFAELQGADLRRANLQLVNITGVEMDLLIELSINDWIENLATEVEDEKILDRINVRLSDRIDQPTILNEAQGEKIFTDAAYDTDIHTLLFDFNTELYGVTDVSVYLNSLYPYLISLACENKWMASGIIHNQFLNFSQTAAAQCLLSLKDQHNQANEPVCPALYEINDDTLKVLKRIAARLPSKDYHPTFECKTRYSDPSPEAVAATESETHE